MESSSSDSEAFLFVTSLTLLVSTPVSQDCVGGVTSAVKNRCPGFRSCVRHAVLSRHVEPVHALPQVPTFNSLKLFLFCPFFLLHKGHLFVRFLSKTMKRLSVIHPNRDNANDDHSRLRQARANTDTPVSSEYTTISRYFEVLMAATSFNRRLLCLYGDGMQALVRRQLNPVATIRLQIFNGRSCCATFFPW